MYKKQLVDTNIQNKYIKLRKSREMGFNATYLCYVRHLCEIYI